MTERYGKNLKGEKMKLIDKNSLYEQFSDLETVALEQVEKHMNDEDLSKWKLWSAILKERTAYKFDIADAPVVDAVPVKHGRWIESRAVLANSTKGTVQVYYSYTCSQCGGLLGRKGDAYCYKCGARMDGKDDADV